MEHFAYLRPIYLFFIIVLAILLLVVMFQKNRLKLVNGFAVVCIGLVCSIASGMMIYQSGIIVDEFSSSGDPVSFLLFAAVMILYVVNVCVYVWRQPKR